MPKKKSEPVISLRGVRHNNLKNFDVDLPTGRLIVVTGLSGSGKSSLAFDTLYAEGQRRYIETFSPYARQFFDRMDKPRVDSIRGIPPAIALEQRNSVKTTRSTVGTMTEICDYMKVLWPHLSRLHCRKCGEIVRKDSPQGIWQQMIEQVAGAELLITFELPLSEKLSLAESLELISRQGYQRLLVIKEGKVTALRLAEAVQTEISGKLLIVIQDRVAVREENRSRFIEGCEQAYHFGKSKLSLYETGSSEERRFSNRLHCARCDIEYREPTSALFSFNHPVGACGACRGFGRVITIDLNLAIPDRGLSLAAGAIKPWQTGHGLESQGDLLKFCKARKIPVNVPFHELKPEFQKLVLEGEPDYGVDEEHQWPQAWYGIKGYFKWLESKAYKMHVRVLLAKYRAYVECPDCKGQRLNSESLLYRAVDENGGAAITLANFYQKSVGEALAFVEKRSASFKRLPNDPINLCLEEVQARLRYLCEVGIGYLTLDRPTRSLSGGETERVNLTTCLGSRLVNTLFVLDEPSVGLHPRDTDRLVSILERLRDNGNTVVVVEHEPAVMKAADQILDIGPGHGTSGGDLVFQGSYESILRSRDSLTGKYLSGRQGISVPLRRPVHLGAMTQLTLSGVTKHNLQNLLVEIPLGRLVCVTGVSGSGKTTLVKQVLFPLLEAQLAESLTLTETDNEQCPPDEEGLKDALEVIDAKLEGSHSLGRVVMVDQCSLGRTPRSNPVVYIGAFEFIRDLFATAEMAEKAGLEASAFSFNSAQGQCEKCRGAGFEKIEMQFLSDVYIRCSECEGRRYRPHILEVKLGEWNIAQFLDASIDEALEFLENYRGQRCGERAWQALHLLQEVGLGYLKTGQPINTLSGGESQRLKLGRHLAEFNGQKSEKPTLFIFDEPTTGLHFDDIRVLLPVFHRLVDAGHSVLVVEHNLEVIKSADWLIDLGPEAGSQGGRIVATGTPEAVASHGEGHTATALRTVL
ncbi:MAG: excinuclease ABC subunit UvrA [Verrucomicrobiota bacterium]|nr:excinuclease ABC subunit UvrA [Verrucomicrobiota bacterium]